MVSMQAPEESAGKGLARAVLEDGAVASDLSGFVEFTFARHPAAIVVVALAAQPSAAGRASSMIGTAGLRMADDSLSPGCERIQASWSLRPQSCP
jgi:hypothetical protein